MVKKSEVILFTGFNNITITPDSPSKGRIGVTEAVEDIPAPTFGTSGVDGEGRKGLSQFSGSDMFPGKKKLEVVFGLIIGGSFGVVVIENKEGAVLNIISRNRYRRKLFGGGVGRGVGGVGKPFNTFHRKDDRQAI